MSNIICKEIYYKGMKWFLVIYHVRDKVTLSIYDPKINFGGSFQTFSTEIENPLVYEGIDPFLRKEIKNNETRYSDIFMSVDDLKSKLIAMLDTCIVVEWDKNDIEKWDGKLD